MRDMSRDRQNEAAGGASSSELLLKLRMLTERSSLISPKARDQELMKVSPASITILKTRQP